MKLMNVDASEVAKSVQGFDYSHIEFDKLGAPEYTIVAIVTDKSGSVSEFKTELENINKTCVESCQKSPKAENLLIRSTAFNGIDGIEELHGFTLLSAIDINQYDGSIEADGMTPLYDATLDGIDTVLDYSKKLYDRQYFCNAIVFVITDGIENSSHSGSVSKIKDAISKIKKGEMLESFTSVLIGVGTEDDQVKDFLENFNKEAGFDQYVEITEATPQKLAKLAKFVSQSVSSTSQALGTQGPSQPIDIKTVTI